MKQLMLPSEIVKKSNQIIRSKLNINNVDGSRILASLIAQIKTDDEHFQEFYTVKAQDFLADKSGRTYTRLKNICRDLANVTAETELISTKTGKPIFAVFTFFRSLLYENGVITARFNEDVRPFLLGLKECFTQYNLMEYLLLPSFYSQRIFEILKSWSGLPEAVISIHDLHQMLDTPQSMRDDFRQFRLRVLEKAHKDILANTNFTFEWSPVKAGKTVEAIKFSFSAVKKEISAKETKKAKEAKQRRLNHQRMGNALDCCEAKKGVCDNRDNKAVVCKICIELGLCADWIRRKGKPFNPSSGLSK